MRNCLKSLACTITYFNPSIALFAMLWGARVANEICFLLLAAHKFCQFTKVVYKMAFDSQINLTL
jgi:hypothetical protein